jgi:hypothetical protein
MIDTILTMPGTAFKPELHFETQYGSNLLSDSRCVSTSKWTPKNPEGLEDELFDVDTKLVEKHDEIKARELELPSVERALNS